MLRHTLAWCGLLVAVQFVAPAHSQPTADVVLYEGARLIPGDGRAAIDESAFLVDRGVITRVGRKGELGAAAGVKRVDLAGKTVMPALINAHGHPGFQKGLTYAAGEFTRENIIDDLNRALLFRRRGGAVAGHREGETHLPDSRRSGGRPTRRRTPAALPAVASARRTPARAPRHTRASPTKSRPKTRTEGLCVSSRRRKWICVKIWVDDRNGRAPRLAPNLYRAIIDEGHKHGLKVNAHVYYHIDAVDLVDAGIDGLAHLVRDKDMDDALVAAIVRRNVYVMPNLGARSGTRTPSFRTG